MRAPDQRQAADLDGAQDAALGPVFGKKVRHSLKPIFETRVRRTVYPIQSGDSEIELTVDTRNSLAARLPARRLRGDGTFRGRIGEAAGRPR
jgi:hypothetical protein